MGWVTLICFILACLGLLVKFGRLSVGALQLTGAMLMLGAAGYAWQGSPSLPSAWVASPAALPADPRASPLRPIFSRDDMILNAADAMLRRHDTRGASGFLNSAIQADPQNATLWLALANTLVAHNGGLVSPAALFAFDRATVLSPNDPKPLFLKGLAFAQANRFDEARATWLQLSAKLPATAVERRDLALRIAVLDKLSRP